MEESESSMTTDWTMTKVTWPRSPMTVSMKVFLMAGCQEASAGR